LLLMVFMVFLFCVVIGATFLAIILFLVVFLWSSHLALLHWCNFLSHRLASHGFFMIFSPCITIVTSLLTITLFMVVSSWSSCLMLMLMQLFWPSPLSLWSFHFALLLVQLF
jgi:hypothetical protein